MRRIVFLKERFLTLFVSYNRWRGFEHILINRALILLSMSAFPLSANSQAPLVVWSPDKTAKAYCENSIQPSCFVWCNGQVVDVSSVEKGNLGKIGKHDYEKVITFPTRWGSNDGTGCMFWFSTQAWAKGQKHTIQEPVWVTDNEYNQR